MIRLVASRVEWSGHSKFRIMQRLAGIDEDDIAAAVIERLRVGAWKWSERNETYNVRVGELLVALGFDEQGTGPVVVTVIDISDRSDFSEGGEAAA
jgi:hypothetical protein